MKLDLRNLGAAMRNMSDGRIFLHGTSPTAVRLFDGRWVFGPAADALEPQGPNVFPAWTFLDYEDEADLALEAEAAALTAGEAVGYPEAPIIRALSIRQPYAEQIMRGTKRFEFRSTRTNLRERIYLYASAKPADDAGAWREMRLAPGALPTGVLVGSVEIVACLQSFDKEEEEAAYLLRAPRRLEPPVVPLNKAGQTFWRPKLPSVARPRRRAAV